MILLNLKKSVKITAICVAAIIVVGGLICGIVLSIIYGVKTLRAKTKFWNLAKPFWNNSSNCFIIGTPKYITDQYFNVGCKQPSALFFLLLVSLLV